MLKRKVVDSCMFLFFIQTLGKIRRYGIRILCTGINNFWNCMTCWLWIHCTSRWTFFVANFRHSCNIQVLERGPTQTCTCLHNMFHISKYQICIKPSPYHTPCFKRRYWVLPTMHCFQWDILYRCHSDEMCLKCKIGMSSVYVRYVSSLWPHMTRCIRYPIGSNALCAVFSIFSCAYLSMCPK